MLALLDLLPVVVFFAAYRFYDIYMATIALIVAMAAVIVVHWLVHGKVSKMLLVSGAFAVVLGGFTLWRRDPVFLQWKPTIVYWIFAIVLLGTDLITEKNIFQRTLGESVQAARGSWRKLNTFWVVVFSAMGVANLYVAFNFTESVWVDFKLYAAIGITVLIFAVTALFLYRNMPEDQR